MQSFKRPMRALIFAAGLGTRLKPLTDDTPKALVKVAGRPMLERVINSLKSYGFREIVINVHHFGQQIIDFVQENHSFGIDIVISDERDRLLDTGGGILKAKTLLDDGQPFLVHNADILTDIDLAEMYNFHLRHTADVTLLVAKRQTSRYFYVDPSGRIFGWKNIKTGEVRPTTLAAINDASLLAFGGLHIISPTIFKALEAYGDDSKFSITPFYVDNCDKLKIMSFQPTKSYCWFDIGTPEKLKDAEIALLGTNTNLL